MVDDLDEFVKVVDLDELLKIAGVTNDSRARSALELNLKLARGHCELSNDKKQTPRALVNQLYKSITKTLALLQKLEKQPAWRDVCFREYVSGDGTAVAVSTRELFEGKLTLPRTPPPPRQHPPTLEVDGTAIAINIRAVLADIQREIVRRALRPKRGQPEKVDKQACVFYARNFFAHHSRHKASTDPKSRFAEFCESFYSAITGTAPPPGALAWHIRKELTKKAARRRA
jgi:hypothetical protein